MKILKLFPDLIYLDYIEPFIGLEQVKFIDSCWITNNKKNSISTNKNILSDPVFSVLKSSIETHLKNYVDTIIVPKNNIELYITQSWMNITKKEESHHAHNHANSFLSGVVYLSVDQNDSITFLRSKPLHPIIELEPNEFNEFNSNSQTLKVNNNMILIFPSSLNHCVDVKTTDTYRISIAFNTFVKGEVGIIDSQNYLKL